MTQTETAMFDPVIITLKLVYLYHIMTRARFRPTLGFLWVRVEQNDSTKEVPSTIWSL